MRVTSSGLLALVLAAFLAWAPASAFALETPADVETDHVDALDDGGPRSAAVVLDALATSRGWVGAEGAVIVADGVAACIGVAGGVAGLRALVREALGVAWFPLGLAFHGWVLLPRFESASAVADVTSPRRVAGALLAGYEWTWPIGLTMRLAAGAAYAVPVAKQKGPAGFEPRLDASAGWTF